MSCTDYCSQYTNKPCKAVNVFGKEQLDYVTKSILNYPSLSASESNTAFAPAIDEWGGFQFATSTPNDCDADPGDSFRIWFAHSLAAASHTSYLYAIF